MVLALRQELEISIYSKTVVIAKVQGCHFFSFVMRICVAKFQNHCYNISRDIVYSVLFKNNSVVSR